MADKNLAKLKFPGDENTYNVYDASAARTSGTLTSGHVSEFDANGKLVDSGLVADNMLWADSSTTTGEVAGAEITSNKVTTIDSTSSDAQYPSAKAAYTAISAKSAVSVSETGTATDEVQYITVDGVEKKLAGGSGGLPSATTAGTAAIYNGTSWVAQEGYGYSSISNIYENDSITWTSILGLYAYQPDPSEISIVAGQTYTVVWGGTSYTLTAIGEGDYLLGEIDESSGEPSFVNYPFCIIGDSNDCIIWAEVNTVTSCIIKGSVYNTIDSNLIYSSASEAGTTMIYDGSAWSQQSGYGYIGGSDSLYQSSSMTWTAESTYYQYTDSNPFIAFSGYQYYVLWDDTEYTVTSTKVSGDIIIGEWDRSSGEPTFTTYPFCIIPYGSTCKVYANTNTVTNCQVYGPYYNKINSNYLPITISTSDPSGGNIGDIWMKYEE